jgi:hypothetical protein
VPRTKGTRAVGISQTSVRSANLAVASAYAETGTGIVRPKHVAV